MEYILTGLEKPIGTPGYHWSLLIFIILSLITIIPIIGFISADTVKCIYRSRFLHFAGSILIALFAGLAFFFSLHAGIISQYDRSNQSTSDYYWFDPINILRYPLQQLSYHSSSFSTRIDATSFKEMQTPPKAFLFLIDKSLSTQTDSIIIKLSEKYRNILLEEIKKLILHVLLYIKTKNSYKNLTNLIY